MENLTPAQIERLVILVEEASEVQQIAMKILRHGYESYNPLDPTGTPNRNLLEKELGDLHFSIFMMAKNGDLKLDIVMLNSRLRKKTITKYLHHEHKI